ncbi:SAM-dependent methyltransferase [Pedobacter sp. ASV28]|uniref:class I SAM-dependent methyltransferase n=1 Tax=Pedobacter sp. ASV28 TaxID=2795123 RepID=UPI001E4AA3E1|nr:SAM-dependent methyltransferase [Pedobacter sp. ASV28]
MGNYKGKEENLKQLYVKKTIIKRKEMLAFNFRYQTRDVFKNYNIEEGIALMKKYLNEGFRIATLFIIDEEFVIETNKEGAFRLRSKKMTEKREADLAHDKEKKRLILAQDNVYLHQLGLTDDKGTVFKNAQDKYKQINQYIELLGPLIKEFTVGTIKNVVDMGSGKGYLTFALYDYLLNHLKKANVVGVEFRKDMVDLCNNIAVKAGFDQLSFVEGTIDNYGQKDINLLVALHACDTATDDAIFKGIQANAELIVVAPCCHKQIRREIEKHKVKNEVSFLTRYGIFLERQAEMVTDGLRALILEYYGYRTKVFEFISDAHTPKNVLVVGMKRAESLKQKVEIERREEILQKIIATKAYFGIGYHHLERLTGLDKVN